MLYSQLVRVGIVQTVMLKTKYTAVEKRIKALEIVICHNACRTEIQSINVDVCKQFIKTDGLV